MTRAKTDTETSLDRKTIFAASGDFKKNKYMYLIVICLENTR